MGNVDASWYRVVKSFLFAYFFVCKAKRLISEICFQYNFKTRASNTWNELRLRTHIPLLFLLSHSFIYLFISLLLFIRLVSVFCVSASLYISSRGCNSVFMVLRMGDMLQPRANVKIHDKTLIRMIDENIKLSFLLLWFLIFSFFTFPLTIDFVCEKYVINSVSITECLGSLWKI